MENIIAAIRNDLSQNKIDEAIKKLNRITTSKFFVPIAQQFKVIYTQYQNGITGDKEYQQKRIEITMKILDQLNVLEQNAAEEKEKHEYQKAQHSSELINDSIPNESNPFIKINMPMDETRDQLMELSLYLEFFDWSQRDYLGKLGALLLRVDQQLRSLPTSYSSFLSRKQMTSSDKQTLQLIGIISSQNNQTRSHIFDILSSGSVEFSASDSKDLLMKTKNIELPKLALQLETLVDRLEDQ